MKTALFRSALWMLLTVALVYAGDDLSLRFRIPHNREQFGSLVVQPYYAIAEKNNKTQFITANPLAVTCVHSLFPHFGANPCWYMAKHTEQRIDE